MGEELFGYSGETHTFLKLFDVRVGDIIRVSRGGEFFEGSLMPRYELADNEHIVIKLKNGYNIGIRISKNLKIEKIGVGIKPVFTSPSSIKEKQDLPNIAIISTGGTIASRIDYRTGAVWPALTTKDILSVVPEISSIANLKTEILFKLLSENVYAPHWTEIAMRVAKYIGEKVDGVVICHGTDTMTYTSAALSFALQNLSVPVILVGSQRSSDRPSSDAAMNLTNAIRAAASVPIAEVMVCMHETISDTSTVLHRGTKVRKLHTSRRDAFKSVNANPLARVEADRITVLENSYNERKSDKVLVLRPDFDEKVALIKFHPGLNPEIIEWYANKGYRGIILEGTGLGHVGRYCFSEIQKAIKKEMFVGMCSQCMYGRVNMKIYETGRDLVKLGVVPLGDMLPETAFIKLSWILGQNKNLDDIKKIMLTNIAGEISSRSIYS
ncbi:MAG: Glu-tRNA(Gln) amidotransferase subunit GatD [Candidatus Bathyarchaeota archaeon]